MQMSDAECVVRRAERRVQVVCVCVSRVGRRMSCCHVFARAQNNDSSSGARCSSQMREGRRHVTLRRNITPASAYMISRLLIFNGVSSPSLYAPLMHVVGTHKIPSHTLFVFSRRGVQRCVCVCYQVREGGKTATFPHRRCSQQRPAGGSTPGKDKLQAQLRSTGKSYLERSCGPAAWDSVSNALSLAWAGKRSSGGLGERERERRCATRSAYAHLRYTRHQAHP